MADPTARPPLKITGPPAPGTGSAFAGREVYLVGVGGCGLSGLALMIQSLGAICRGSDAVPSELTKRLAASGIPVVHDQDAGRLPERCDLVIVSAAIKPDHPEMLAAEQRGIPVLSYAEALGMLQAERTGVSIAGTHGKSTTAAMLCHALIECGLDPSFIVGATCAQIGGGSRVGAPSVPGEGLLAGRPGLLVCEACEFNRSFHHHRPMVGLINNVEEDHLDIYGSLEKVVEAFAEFARLIPAASEGGRLLISHDDAHRGHITPGLCCAVETFGFHPQADWRVEYEPMVQRVSIAREGMRRAQWTNQLPGAHNALNAAAAGILAHWFGAAWTDVAEALGRFRGVERRMQRLGTRALHGGTVVVYDDYGHHPTEIEHTLKALRMAEDPKRLICVFQPHQHSRTRFLLEQFAESFSHADVVIVPHIYFVRDSEKEKQRVNATDLVDRLLEKGIRASHLYPFRAIVDHLELTCRDGDLLVIMGAGPVWQVAREFLVRGRRQAQNVRPAATSGS